MLLTEFQVTRFRNVVDSLPISVEPDITCLVGKNESGKTALLQALHGLNSSHGADFDVDEQYPRWLLIRDRKAGDVEDTSPIRAVFSFEDDDVKALDAALGPGVIEQETVTICRRYSGGRIFNLRVSEGRAVGALLNHPSMSEEAKRRLGTNETLEGLQRSLDEWQREENGESLQAELAGLEERRSELLGEEGTLWAAAARLVTARMPRFFYFSDYSILPGRVDLTRLAGADAPAASGMQTARALLELAGTDTEALRNEDYELRKAELEAVSNELTRQVFEYWTQNRELSVTMDVDKVTEQTPQGQTAVARHLDVRVLDRRHGYTNNFGQRSSGFQWFFSFLAAFSEFEDYEGRVVVLLDEPALTLHGRAQADFLRFIEERLAPNGQVLYTTHSPFMVDPSRLERARIVEDRDEEGAVVSSEALAVGHESLFPLQAALGYDIAQSLFLGADNLLVEGTSDFTYLSVLSEYLRSQDRTGLDERWRVLPAGGAQNIPAFVALLGGHLEVTVLVDAGTQGMQRLTNLAQRGLLDQQRLVTVAEVTGTKQADIEDVFTIEDYLTLFNAAFKRRVKADKLPPGDRVVKRIAALDKGQDFDHGTPADHLLRNRDKVCPRLSEETLERFTQLFERLNSTIE